VTIVFETFQLERFESLKHALHQDVGRWLRRKLLFQKPLEIVERYRLGQRCELVFEFSCKVFNAAFVQLRLEVFDLSVCWKVGRWNSTSHSVISSVTACLLCSLKRLRSSISNN
jgi:hypothetical protein